jgi:hypothetical protein
MPPSPFSRGVAIHVIGFLPFTGWPVLRQNLAQEFILVNQFMVIGMGF